MATPTQAPSKLVDLLSSAKPNLVMEIVDTILFNLNIVDIYSLHAASRSLSWLVGYMHESPRLLSINKHLGPFVQDAALFRRKLRECEGIIGGDFVLNFFMFGRYKVSTLDVFVDRGDRADDFVKYLCEQEHYEIQNNVLVRLDVREN